MKGNLRAVVLNRIVYKESLWIFLSKTFVSMARVIATIIFSYQLTVSVYGTYQNFWVQVSTLFAFSGLSLSSFVFSYSPGKLISIYKSLNKTIYLVGIGIVLLSGIVFAYLQRDSGINFGWAILFLAFNSFSLIVDALLTVFKKFSYLVLGNFAYLLLFVGIHFLALSQQPFSLNFLIAILVGITAGKSALIFVVLKEIRHPKKLPEPLTDYKFKRFWLHLYLFEIVQIIFKFSDKFVVSLFTTPSISAIYQNATYTIPLISIVFSAVSGAIFMQFSLAERNLKMQARILKDSGRTFALVALPLFFILMFFNREFITLFFSDKYLESIPIFKMSLWMIPFSIFNFTLLLRRHEEGRILNIGLVIDVLGTLLLVYPLYHFLGLKGIPLAFVGSTLLQVIYYLRYHEKILGLGLTHFLPLKDWLIKAIIFGLVAYFAHYFLVDLAHLKALPSLIYCSLIFLIVIAFYVNKELKIWDFWKGK